LIKSPDKELKEDINVTKADEEIIELKSPRNTDEDDLDSIDLDDEIFDELDKTSKVKNSKPLNSIQRMGLAFIESWQWGIFMAVVTMYTLFVDDI